MEILPHYSNIDNSCWIIEGVQLIIDNVVREKFLVLLVSLLSSRNFSLNFWYLPVFVVVLVVLTLDSYWWLKNDSFHCFPIEVSLGFWFPLEAIRFNGFDFTSFLKNFFIVIIFFTLSVSLYLNFFFNKTVPKAIKIIIIFKKFTLKLFFINGSDNFLDQYF